MNRTAAFLSILAVVWVAGCTADGQTPPDTAEVAPSTPPPTGWHVRGCSVARGAKALFMTVWRPRTRSAEHRCGIRQG